MRGGSPKAKRFHRAVESVRPRLVRQAAALVGPNEAEDVVQQAMLDAWRLTRNEPRDWEAWLWRCVINQSKRRLRSRRNEPVVLSLDGELEKELCD